MHPDHARSFVLANSLGGGGERGGFAVRTPKYTYARVRMHTDKLRRMREGGREGRSTPSWIRSGRVRTASSGVLNILRIPFAGYLAGCFKTQPARYINPYPLHLSHLPSVRDTIFCCSLHSLHYSSSEISGPLPADVCQLLHAVVSLSLLERSLREFVL